LRIALDGKLIAELRSVTCHMGCKVYANNKVWV